MITFGNLVWITIFLLFWIPCSQSNQVSERSSSSSSGTGVAPQTCGTDNFFCQYDPTERCKPRNQRCTGQNICNNPTTMMEEGCLETSVGKYKVQLGHAELPSIFGSSRKREVKAKYEHQFVTFRGFTYEFGKSYGVQVLDITDPIYKYQNGNGLNSKGIETRGSSYCTWEDANTVVRMWKSAEYALFTKNCQHFADAMLDILLYSSCNQPTSRSKREGRDAQLAQYIDKQLRNCSLVCCYDGSDGTTGSMKQTKSIIWVITALAVIILIMF